MEKSSERRDRLKKAMKVRRKNRTNLGKGEWFSFV